MEVGPDGVYVGHNTELVHFDWNGNRSLLLSGFGNGDSHQTINCFAWSPDGELWFCQGDGIESRVETPYGVSSLFQAGVYRLRPGSLQLDPLLDDFMGPGNPWGIAFDDFGQSFVVDGAGGISYLTPGSIPAKRRLPLPRIGAPGGYCGVDDLGDGSFGLGDYKKNQVTRFRTLEDGGGFKVEFVEPLLRSEHRNFRPVDVKLGPDGAIYIVDWYNPITCHQDDFYRHPIRDKTHGRIWRVAKKGTAQQKPQALTKASDGELIDALKSPNRWTRMKAKQVLTTRGLKTMPAVVQEWRGRDLLEAAGLAVWCGMRITLCWNACLHLTIIAAGRMPLALPDDGTRSTCWKWPRRTRTRGFAWKQCWQRDRYLRPAPSLSPPLLRNCRATDGSTTLSSRPCIT